MVKKLQVGIIAPAVALACLSLPRAASQTQSHEAETAGTTTHTAQTATSKKAFIRQAAEGGMAQMQMGELASRKQSRPKSSSSPSAWSTTTPRPMTS